MCEYETEDQIDRAMARVHAAFGTRTQVELAERLGIRQSSISDAKRRKNIPETWLLKLVKAGWNPVYIETGEGPKHIVLSADGKGYAAADALADPDKIARTMTEEMVLKRFGGDPAVFLRLYERCVPGHAVAFALVPRGQRQAVTVSVTMEPEKAEARTGAAPLALAAGGGRG